MAFKLERFSQVVKLKGLNTQKTIASRPETALVAGGDTVAALTLSATALGIYAGSGAPTISAPQGSIYLRSDGSGVANRLYINTNGSTTWTAVSTAA